MKVKFVYHDKRVNLEFEPNPSTLLLEVFTEEHAELLELPEFYDVFTEITLGVSEIFRIGWYTPLTADLDGLTLTIQDIVVFKYQRNYARAFLVPSQTLSQYLQDRTLQKQLDLPPDWKSTLTPGTLDKAYTWDYITEQQEWDKITLEPNE
ncbi:hypothetical protein HY407_02830 [Candidatus Gottesmanbacteria bacterium]|nr:hypothetical protein [Candidatus Gottesmanbacteria bacterium]